MQIAVALPQLGRASSARAIKDVAVLAEQLGFSDIWVNDHLGFAPDEDHPSPRMYEPLTALAVAAAVTSRIGLGSHVNAANYPPVWLARALASLDALCEGRLKLVAGAGWQAAEFTAAGNDFRTRGQRLDEILALLRQCWASGNAEWRGEHYHFPPLKLTPAPAHAIPIWIGGTTEAALARAVVLGDGYQGQPTRRESPETWRQTPLSKMPALVARLRERRPDPETFRISIYTHDWDPLDSDADVIRRERDLLAAAGVQHAVVAIHQRSAEDWMRAVEMLAGVMGLG